MENGRLEWGGPRGLRRRCVGERRGLFEPFDGAMLKAHPSGFSF